jgi:leucyl aminopeptidase
MTQPMPFQFAKPALDTLAGVTGRIVVLAEPGQPTSPGFRRLDRLARGALGRAVGSDAFARLKPGEGLDLGYPSGLEASAVQILRLPKRADQAQARKAGAAIGLAHGALPTLVLAEGHARASDLAFGMGLRIYDFNDHKTGEKKVPGPVTFAVTDPEAAPRPRWRPSPKASSSPAIW